MSVPLQALILWKSFVLSFISFYYHRFFLSLFSYRIISRSSTCSKRESLDGHWIFVPRNGNVFIRCLESTYVANQNFISNLYVLFDIYCVNLYLALVGNNCLKIQEVKHSGSLFNKILPLISCVWKSLLSKYVFLIITSMFSVAQKYSAFENGTAVSVVCWPLLTKKMFFIAKKTPCF